MKLAEKKNNCISFNFNKIELFQHLKKEELEIINFAKKVYFLERGKILYEEGNHLSGVYFLYSGILKLYKRGSEGKEQIVQLVKCGELIAFNSVIFQELAEQSAKAIENSQLFLIPTHIFINIVKNNPLFSFELLQIQYKELNFSHNLIMALAQKKTQERFAQLLIYIKEKFNTDNDNYLNISLTREEMANIIGTSTETVIRTLSDFKQKKLLELNKKRIKIKDIKKIQQIALNTP